MMKRILVISLLLLIGLSMLSAITIERKERNISAYKLAEKGENPDQIFLLRILDPKEAEFGEDYDVVLPVEARGVSYKAFSWVMGGNIFKNISISFQFSPMTVENANGSTLSTVIPISVGLYHVATSIGNTAIGTETRTGPSGAPIKYTYYNSLGYGTEYDFYYADNVSITNPAGRISTSNGTARISYDMSSHTYVSNYPSEANICNYWVRSGEARITMYIPSDASGFASGKYITNVIVTVTSGT